MEPKITKLESTEFELIEDNEEDAAIQDDTFVCPDCGSDSVIVVSHCKTCVSCGWSLCSL